ncbi:MAG: hypothetical protein CVU56_14755 [Deltaproteobacteria bacterium HGW-Deltaproteobacteria-14]|jgi:hypothetical protein|nr:MAG: hypothetical protein CVU56_14755 [Deltaproteobacteria bacterium HGW-Deltaproteobacteria-14]
MRWFDYFGTFDESMAMVADLCASGLRVVAEPHPFDQPEAPAFAHVDAALRATLRAAPSFYFAGAFTRFPVQFTQLASGAAAGKYVVDLLAQGPLLQALVARENVVDGGLQLLPGRLSYQASYRNPETGIREKASDELKASYRVACKALRKRCVRHAIGGAGFFIGPQALALLERGEVAIAPDQIVPMR